MINAEGQPNINCNGIKVFFDAERGTPRLYEYSENDCVVDTYGGGRAAVTALVKPDDLIPGNKDGDECDLIDADCVFSGFAAEENAVAASYSVICRGDEACNAGEFSIKYMLREGSLYISLDRVNEADGFHLIEIRLDELMTFGSETKFVTNRRGGHISDPLHIDGDSMPVDDGEWRGYPNMSIFPVLAFISERSVCVTETLGYVCNTRLTVDDGVTSFGVRVPYRIRGGENTPDIIVNQAEICRIDFAGDFDGNGTVDWLDAAKLERSKLPPIRDTYFDDKFVFIIQNKLGRRDTELTLRQTEDLIGRIANLTDRSPSVAMLTGWSRGGHDTSYPNIFSFEPTMGSEEDYFALKASAETKYNCNVSLNDNFDDQYDNEYTRGHFTLENIGRRRDGTPETFNAWNGRDVSYITGMAKYMRDGGHGERRIDWECEHYGVKKAMLIDALSWWSVRHDWDPASPASAVDNIRAKHKIIDRFKSKYDVNIVSELVRYPFIGKMCLAFDNNVCFWNPTDGDVPFMRVALRDRMIYGQKPGDSLDVSDFLYHNSAKHPWFRKDETSGRIADIFYLNYVPWFVVKSLDMEAYSCSGGVYDMRLEGDVSIHIDYNGRQWYIKRGENMLLKNNTVSCPMSGGRIAFYSKDGDAELSYILSDGKSVRGARELHDDGAIPCEYGFDGKRVTVFVKKETPVIVDIQ